MGKWLLWSHRQFEVSREAYKTCSINVSLPKSWTKTNEEAVIISQFLLIDVTGNRLVRRSRIWLLKLKSNQHWTKLNYKRFSWCRRIPQHHSCTLLSCTPFPRKKTYPKIWYLYSLKKKMRPRLMHSEASSTRNEIIHWSPYTACSIVASSNRIYRKATKVLILSTGSLKHVVKHASPVNVKKYPSKIRSTNDKGPTLCWKVLPSFQAPFWNRPTLVQLVLQHFYCYHITATRQWLLAILLQRQKWLVPTGTTEWQI